LAEGLTMTAPGWLQAVHPGRRLHWQAPHLPRLRLTPGQVAALRRGLIVALCALLAGALSVHLRGAAQGPFAPAPSREAIRA